MQFKSFYFKIVLSKQNIKVQDTHKTISYIICYIMKNVYYKKKKINKNLYYQLKLNKKVK